MLCQRRAGRRVRIIPELLEHVAELTNHDDCRSRPDLVFFSSSAVINPFDARSMIRRPLFEERHGPGLPALLIPQRWHGGRRTTMGGPCSYAYA